jgi:hypothetical protein
MREGFDAYDELTRRLLPERHGFSVFDEVRAAEFRDDAAWLAVARAGGEVVGAVRYEIEKHGGDLVAKDLLVTGPLGRALLLQFFARHVDQVARVIVRIGVDDVPELWGTDLAVTIEGAVSYPRQGGPMVRVLDMPALAGTPVGPGDVTIGITGDELIGGVWRLASDGGALAVSRGTDPVATLSSAGFAGLLYGVLDPIEVVTRGLGVVSADVVGPLSSMFPRQMPYLFANF